MRRYNPESGEAPYWDEHTIELEPHRSVLEGILQARDRFDGSIGIRCSCRRGDLRLLRRARQRPAGARLPHAPRQGAAERREEGRRDRGSRPMGNMPVLKDLIVDMDAVHWKKIQRVTPWLLQQAAGARARVHRRARVDGRRDAVDGLHPVRRLRLGLPVDGGRPRLHRARPRWPRPTASSATRATASSTSASTTSPRTRTASTTARTASSASRPARRASRRWARSCACAAIAGQRPRHRRPQQRRAPRGSPSPTSSATTACCTRPRCCRAPTAATRGSASSILRPTRKGLATRCRSLIKGL